MAIVASSTFSTTMLRSPLAAYSPATNSSESPGKKATIAPVSRKMIRRERRIATPLDDRARIAEESDQVVDELHGASR